MVLVPCYPPKNRILPLGGNLPPVWEPLVYVIDFCKIVWKFDCLLLKGCSLLQGFYGRFVNLCNSFCSRFFSWTTYPHENYLLSRGVRFTETSFSYIYESHIAVVKDSLMYVQVREFVCLSAKKIMQAYHFHAYAFSRAFACNSLK